jgi:K+-sensing histidine kinase KdpD
MDESSRDEMLHQGDIVTVRDRQGRMSTDPRLAAPYAAAAGFAVTLTLAAAFSLLQGHVSLNAETGIMAAAVLVLSWWCSVSGALVTAGTAYLMLNGFAEDQSGTLRWHGTSDLMRISVFVGVAIAVSGLRAIAVSRRTRIRRNRSRRAASARPSTSDQRVIVPTAQAPRYRKSKGEPHA